MPKILIGKRPLGEQTHFVKIGVTTDKKVIVQTDDGWVSFSVEHAGDVGDALLAVFGEFQGECTTLSTP